MGLLKMLETGSDHHKARGWMMLLLDALMEQLGWYYLEEKGEGADAEGMLKWLDEEHLDDKTLTFIKQMVLLLQQRELLHWSMRCNRADVHTAASTGELLDLLYARAAHCYSRTTMEELALYAFEPGDERITCMAPQEVCELRARNFCGGRARRAQPLDLLQEQIQRMIHRLGPGVTAAGARGVTAMFDVWFAMRKACLMALGIEEVKDKDRSHKDTTPDYEGAQGPECPALPPSRLPLCARAWVGRRCGVLCCVRAAQDAQRDHVREAQRPRRLADGCPGV